MGVLVDVLSFIHLFHVSSSFFLVVSGRLFPSFRSNAPQRHI